MFACLLNYLPSSLSILLFMVVRVWNLTYTVFSETTWFFGIRTTLVYRTIFLYHLTWLHIQCCLLSPADITLMSWYHLTPDTWHLIYDTWQLTCYHLILDICYHLILTHLTWYCDTWLDTIISDTCITWHIQDYHFYGDLAWLLYCYQTSGTPELMYPLYSCLLHCYSC